MEESTTNSNNGLKRMMVPVAVLAIIAIAVIYFYASGKNPASNTSTPVTNSTTQEETDTQTATTTTYKDGTYDETGSYVSPGGQREVSVSVALADDVITDATFEGLATDPASERFQKEFADNYKSMVVGKNISEVNLTKVAGSSLTPKGFTDALTKIKAKAQS